MKKIILCIICLFTFSINNRSSAQCTIDYSQVNPGVYPDSLPPATVSQPYSADVTFVLLTDTLGLTIYNYEIANITGLPIGLSWQCNNFANGCNYDPAVSIYGCINVSGTPILAGNYVAAVTVIADIQLAGTQIVTYDVPITVFPGVVNNPGFSMINSTGCAPITVTFINNNPGQTAYLWDFGNGLQSNLENPPAQTYTAPGDYIITQTVTPNIQPDYYLTAIEVTSIPNNYGSPIDDPDMYFYLRNQAGATIYDSHPSLNGVFPPYTWALPNIQLNNETYSVHVWDEDGGLFGADDDLGEITFPGWSASGNATGTVGGASGALNVNYTIFQTPVNPLIAVDTIHVYPVPAVPTISSSGPVIFCDGDSVILTCSDSVNVQWYNNGTIMVGFDNQSITITQSGNYTTVVTNSYGCTAVSASTPITVNPNPPKPTFFIVGNNTFVTTITGYFLQWYLNGSPIPGATDSTYDASVAGTYMLVITDSNGCFHNSDTLAFIPTSIADINSGINSLSVFPNPSKGSLNISFNLATAALIKMTVTDLLGKEVYQQLISGRAGANNYPIDLSDLNAGAYIFTFSAKGNAMNRRIMITR